MNRKLYRLAVLLTIILLLAACGGPSPSQKYVAGEVLLTESFSEPSAWEAFTAEGMDFQVVDGAYRVQTEDGGYVWGLNAAEHTDVMLEVTSTQHSSYENNAYGVMCRANIDNNGDGYYFLISGDGFYSIAKGEGDSVNRLVDWTSSPAINQGQASNTIRAVCLGNYLALYVNGQFMAEIEDIGYSAGFAGFAATAFEGGDTDIAFDNLTITAVSPAN